MDNTFTEKVKNKTAWCKWTGTSKGQDWKKKHEIMVTQATEKNWGGMLMSESLCLRIKRKWFGWGICVCSEVEERMVRELSTKQEDTRK